jgi:hypothetical protein
MTFDSLPHTLYCVLFVELVIGIPGLRVVSDEQNCISLMASDELIVWLTDGMYVHIS